MREFEIKRSLLLNENEQQEILNNTKNEVINMCKKYPIYTEPY